MAGPELAHGWQNPALLLQLIKSTNELKNDKFKKHQIVKEDILWIQDSKEPKNPTLQTLLNHRKI